jgi:heme a synthase
MTPAARLVLFRRLAIVGVLLAFFVVVLGAWVRLNAAGLGCPDWPGCYGHLTVEGAANHPDDVASHASQRPLEYAKAIKEMVHRYFASSLGLLCVVLAGMAIVNRRQPLQPVALPLCLVALVILQGLLGMWTVTLLLKPLIVTLHLLGGLTTFSLLAWLAMKPIPQSTTRNTTDLNLKQLAFASLLILAFQIALGGWTSSNYAAFACPDFPTCQNSYWPNMDVKDAFVLWRGLGIDYEGGVLTHPARVAIHFTHRVGAFVTTLLLGFTAYRAWRSGASKAIRIAGMLVGIALLTQIILGPVMVMRALPLNLATAHNAVAALLLLSVVRLNRVVR